GPVRRDRVAIDALGLRVVPALVQQQAHVDVGIDEPRIAGDRARVGLGGGFGIALLERDAAVVPLLGVGLLQQRQRAGSLRLLQARRACASLDAQGTVGRVGL